ncbi:hypothetical protein [Aestuariivirga sp.]|uniref:hypothetical protein n=1 Tax=Aestuariivirga sp. TaxID=2650926 RepID=UPI0035AE54E7
MRQTGRDELPLPLANAPTTASLYCLAAMVADEASGNGFREFAKDLEAAMGRFLAGLPSDQQANALRLSYEIMMSAAEATEEAPAPRLRLVYSR